MNVLMNTSHGQADFRRRLLASVSAAALAALACTPDIAFADDRPTVWIELGGQLEKMQGGQEPFVPPFMADMPSTFRSPTGAQRPLLYSQGGEGAISFEPEDSDWIFSASIRYGRSNGARHQHKLIPNAKIPAHLTYNGKYYNLGTKYPTSHAKFEDLDTRQAEAHTIVDFQVGKDVGLGMFGHRGSSVLSGGIRIAQLNSKSSIDLHMEPDVQYPTAPISDIPEAIAWFSAKIRFHDVSLLANSQRSFRGLGPSVAWNASLPIAGNSDSGEIALDWGANAAILFGRQKVKGHHQTTVLSYYKGNGVSYHKHDFVVGISAFGTISEIPHNNAAPINRSRTVSVPNAGGFVGLSFVYPNAKVSFGYRADFFFNAIDGGIDTAKKENRGFFGPFASISVGLGD